MILSTPPSAGVESLAALLLFGIAFDLIGLVTIVLLLGTVKKNDIMLVYFTIVAERDEQLSARDAERRSTPPKTPVPELMRRTL